MDLEVQSFFDDIFKPEVAIVAGAGPAKRGSTRKGMGAPVGTQPFWFGAAGHQYELTDKLKTAILRYLAEKQPDTLICACRGNEHSIVSMLQHPIPFDFRIPGEEGTLIPRAEELPYALIKAQLSQIARNNSLLFWDFLTSECREVFRGPLYMLPPPPPIGNAEHILSYPSSFGALASRYGVTPAPLRAKLWRVYVRILKDASQAKNQLFVNLPETIFTNGCLSERFWSEDPTHGNKAYGKVILEHVLSKTNQEILA